MFWGSLAKKSLAKVAWHSRAIPKHANKAKNTKKNCFYNEIMRKIISLLRKNAKKLIPNRLSSFAWPDPDNLLGIYFFAFFRNRETNFSHYFIIETIFFRIFRFFRMFWDSSADNLLGICFFGFFRNGEINFSHYFIIRTQLFRIFRFFRMF